MKINFISYLHPFKYHGGGELGLRMVIEHGRRRGHQIRIFARRTGKLSKLIPGRSRLPPADLHILADIYNCPESKAKVSSTLIERIISRERYIHIDSAYVDVCRRPALPCHGDISHCVAKCLAKQSIPLYARSLANVFLSPLHYRIVSGLVSPSSIPNPLIALPFVDVELFPNLQLQRDVDYLYVGTIAGYKGYENLKRELLGKDILFIGHNATGERLFGRHIPHVPHDQLAWYYNRARYLVHLPDWPEPQGRNIVEGALCGCKLVTNENVGAMTFDSDPGDRELIRQAPDLFWREVEARCGSRSAPLPEEQRPGLATCPPTANGSR